MTSCRTPEGEVRIAIVGKYTNLLDSYKSLAEALTHGGIANRVKVHLDWVDSEIFEQPDPAVHRLEARPRHPGSRRLRRTRHPGQDLRPSASPASGKVPFFGICFGMQMAVIEAARALAGIDEANSTEFGATREPVVGLLTEWMRGNELQIRASEGDKGGTMRLGAYQAHLKQGSRIAKIYGDTIISERHRHRYEVNTHYRETLQEHGMNFAGMSPDGLLPETIEYPDHPWFIGVQYHPELKSRPFEPHPLFASFIAAAKEQSRLV